jgi:membrane protein
MMDTRIITSAIKHLGMRLFSDDLHDRATSLAYRFFLALFPFAIFVVALSGFVASAVGAQDLTDQMLDRLGDIPIDLADRVRRELEVIIEEDQPGLLSLGLLGTLWPATTGMNAFIREMDRAYRVKETRPGWKRYALAIGLTLLSGTAIVGGFVVLVSGEVAGDHLARVLGLGELFRTVIGPARWAFTAGLLLLAMALLYRTAPNIHLPWRLALPGAVLFTAGWSLATFLFSLYVANFGVYSATYGALAGAAVLLIWFYVTALLLLLGADLNAFIGEWLDPALFETERYLHERETQTSISPSGQ